MSYRGSIEDRDFFFKAEADIGVRLSSGGVGICNREQAKLVFNIK